MKTAVRMKSQAGFSLIELMIVVAIIGILATIAIPNFQRFQMKAKQAEAKTYLSAIYTGEKAFASEFDTFIPCVNAIGFDRDGANPRYNAGFTAGAAMGGYTGVCTNFRGASPTGVATVSSATAFVAAANAPAGNLGPGSGQDRWTINEGRTIQNTNSGL